MKSNRWQPATISTLRSVKIYRPRTSFWNRYHKEGKSSDRYLGEVVRMTLICILESEFEPVFGMTRAAFDAMPKWKQDNKKKAVGLF